MSSREGGYPGPASPQPSEKIKKSPAPRFHAATQARRVELYQGFSSFLEAYRRTAEKLKAGEPAPPFPRGSFPPALPFVSAEADGEDWPKTKIGMLRSLQEGREGGGVGGGGTATLMPGNRCRVSACLDSLGQSQSSSTRA